MTKAKTPTKITDVKEARERKKSDDASKKQQKNDERSDESRRKSPPVAPPPDKAPPPVTPPPTDGLRDAIASFHLEVIENAWQHRTEFAKCQRASCVAMRARLKR